MKTKIAKTATYWLGVVALGLVLGISIQFVTAWTEPTATAPGGNLGAPINTSVNLQTKLGNFIAQNLGAINLTLVGKGTSASTVAADLGTTLVTKDYVDAGSGAGSCQFFSVGKDCGGYYCDNRSWGAGNVFDLTTKMTADKICQDKGYAESESYRSKDCNSMAPGSGVKLYFWSGKAWLLSAVNPATCLAGNEDAGEITDKIDYIYCCK